MDLEFLRPEPAVFERLVGVSSDRARPMGFFAHQLGVTPLLRLLKDRNHASWSELENALHESNPIHTFILACPEQGCEFLRAMVTGAISFSPFWFGGARERGVLACKPPEDLGPRDAHKTRK